MTTATTGADTRDMLVVHDAVRHGWGLAPGLVRAVEAGDTRRADRPTGDSMMLRHLPLPARFLLPRLARRAYARYALAVHGTATP